MLYFGLQWLQSLMFLNLQGQNCWAQDFLVRKARSKVRVFASPQAVLSLVRINPFLLEKTNLVQGLTTSFQRP